MIGQEAGVISDRRVERDLAGGVDGRRCRVRDFERVGAAEVVNAGEDVAAEHGERCVGDDRGQFGERVDVGRREPGGGRCFERDRPVGLNRQNVAVARATGRDERQCAGAGAGDHVADRDGRNVELETAAFVRQCAARDVAGIVDVEAGVVGKRDRIGSDDIAPDVLGTNPGGRLVGGALLDRDERVRGRVAGVEVSRSSRCAGRLDRIDPVFSRGRLILDQNTIAGREHNAVDGVAVFERGRECAGGRCRDSSRRFEIPTVEERVDLGDRREGDVDVFRRRGIPGQAEAVSLRGVVDVAQAGEGSSCRNEDP